ncbi:MAG: hypothetical protein RBT59_10865 [Arcobacteraceae bacterium]|jgi:hypothetical protein|nr:hypothetical protein [Arcobacteraceae bacterium]
MAIYVLYLEDSNGNTTQKEVDAENSIDAVNDNLDGSWVMMSKNEMPRGVYESGTYSVERGYVTVKKPNKIHDWLKRI